MLFVFFDDANVNIVLTYAKLLMRKRIFFFNKINISEENLAARIGSRTTPPRWATIAAQIKKN